jgi:hypothetical protein
MAQLDKRYEWVFHPRNEQARDARQGARYKQAGVTAGVSDIIVPYPCGGFHGLMVELKTDKGRLSEEQKDFLHEMSERGYKTAVCRSVGEVQIELIQYFGGMNCGE